MTLPAQPRRRRVGVIVTVAILGTIAVCVGGIAIAAGLGGDGGTAPVAATSAQCLPVDAAVLARIAAGAQVGTGLRMTGRAAAVRSPDHGEVYLVAAQFTATGVGPQIGVWATNRIGAEDGLMLSVDGYAKRFTKWGDAATTTDARIGPADGSALAALACLK